MGIKWIPDNAMGTVMSPEELLQKVYQMIDGCFARGMELREVLAEIENYIASLET